MRLATCGTLGTLAALRISRRLLPAAIGLALACQGLRAGQEGRSAGGAAPGVRSFHVQGQVWVIAGAGGNVIVQAGNAKAEGPGAGEGVLVVDTGAAGMTAALVSEIKRIAPGRIEYIVNTSGDPEHVGGNELLAKPQMDFLSTPGSFSGPGVKIIGHEAVLPRMSLPGPDGKVPYPAAAWPNATYSLAQRRVFFNDEPIVVTYVPAAHSDGDSFVHFRRSDVIATGDLFDATRYPVIERARGGTVAGIIAGLNRVLDLMVPRYNQEGGTYVVPGHGRVCDQHDLLEYRDMLVIVRDRIKAAVEKGWTLAQVKAQRPTLDYDARWGADAGPWTTDMFIEAIYAEYARTR
jgi:glyoxylase-like metal-dependent hydrolase (beta-lactamase superfamily II)